jgi:hypothetical protein
MFAAQARSAYGPNKSAAPGLGAGVGQLVPDGIGKTSITAGTPAIEPEIALIWAHPFPAA